MIQGTDQQQHRKGEDTEKVDILMQSYFLLSQKTAFLKRKYNLYYSVLNEFFLHFAIKGTYNPPEGSLYHIN